VPGVRTVIASAGSESKRQRAIGLGADHVVDPTDPDWLTQVLDVTDDVALEASCEARARQPYDGPLRSLRRRARVRVAGGGDIRCGVKSLQLWAAPLIDPFRTPQRDRRTGRDTLRMHSDHPTTTTAAYVVLMCGIAGSGKTTYAQRLEHQGYERLSIDEEVWRRFGRYGVDYAADDYDGLSAAVEADLQIRLSALLMQGRQVVIDFSFWQRARRDHCKHQTGSLQAADRTSCGTWRLVYLKVDAEELGRRLTNRNTRVDANATFPITDALLDRYLHDFEEPRGEGEEVIWKADPSPATPCRPEVRHGGASHRVRPRSRA